MKPKVTLRTINLGRRAKVKEKEKNGTGTKTSHPVLARRLLFCVVLFRCLRGPPHQPPFQPPALYTAHAYVLGFSRSNPWIGRARTLEVVHVPLITVLSHTVLLYASFLHLWGVF
jgi:hypothetical protein